MRISVIILSLLIPVFTGDEPPADEAKQKAETQRDFYAKTAAQYEFFHDLAKQQPLKLIEKPVMTWTNACDCCRNPCCGINRKRAEPGSTLQCGLPIARCG